MEINTIIDNVLVLAKANKGEINSAPNGELYREQDGLVYCQFIIDEKLFDETEPLMISITDDSESKERRYDIFRSRGILYYEYNIKEDEGLTKAVKKALLDITLRYPAVQSINKGNHLQK